MFRQHPFDGIGPGQLTVQRTDGTGRLHVQPFVHDEYLQTLAEDGLPGGLLLLGVLGGTLLALWRSRGLTADRLVWAGALAALAAALIHAGFDFGWHIPAVPLIMAALVGLALAPAGQETGHVPERRED